VGLDQYLTAKKFLSPSEWRGEAVNKQYDTIIKAAEAEKLVNSPFPNASVEISVGYWRKENAIHQWFVDNCQGGEDDCRESHVSREQLETLKSICETILLDKNLVGTDDLAKKMLPTSAGFFFGSQDFDEWYYKGLEDTIEIVSHCLSPEFDGWDFYYQSSW
jgi:hypothetical protein